MRFFVLAGWAFAAQHAQLTYLTVEPYGSLIETDLRVESIRNALDEGNSIGDPGIFGDAFERLDAAGKMAGLRAPPDEDAKPKTEDDAGGDVDFTAPEAPDTDKEAPETPLTAKDKHPAHEGEAEWRSMGKITLIVLAILVVILLGLVALIVRLWLWYDRVGVDEGKELPPVSAQLSTDYLEENSAGYDKAKKEWIPLVSFGKGEFDLYESLGNIAGVGMQAYFIILYQAFWVNMLCLALLIPMMGYDSMGGHAEAAAVWTAADLDPDVAANAHSFQDHWTSRLLFVNWSGHASATTLTVGLAINDAISVLVITCWAMWLYLVTFPFLKRKLERERGNIGEFVVLVDGLPGHLEGDKHAQYETVLREHMIKIVNQRREEKGITSEVPVEIKEVVLCRDYEGQLGKFEELVSLRETRDIEKDKHRSEKVEALEAEITALEAKLEEGRKSPETLRVSRAYVMFRRQGDTDLLVEAYKRFKVIDSFPRDVAEELAFEGNRKIEVVRATEPEDVNWDQQGFDRDVRSKAVVISIIIQVISFAAFMYGLSVLTTTKLAHKEMLADCFDEAGCIPPVAVDDALNMGLSKDGLLPNCVCAGVGTQHILQTEELWHPCNDYMMLQVWLKIMSLVLVGCVFVVCEILEAILEGLAQFEKPLTYSQAEYNLFCTMYRLNLFAKIMVVVVVTLKLFGGDFIPFTPVWFAEVGDLVVLQIMVSIVAINFVRIFKGVIAPWILGFFFKLFSHQKIANKVGCFRFEFEPSKRSSEFYMLFTACFLFYTGMPVLLVIFAIWVTVQAFMDRMFLLRGCSRSNLAVNLQIPNAVASYLCIVMFLHCLFAAWTLGSPQLYLSELMGWAKPIVLEDPENEHPHWDSEHIAKLSKSQLVALHFGSQAAIPNLVMAALIFLFWATVFFAWLCGRKNLLNKLTPDSLVGVDPCNNEKDVEQVIPEIEKLGRLASYDPEKHPKLGPTVTAFFNHKGPEAPPE